MSQQHDETLSEAEQSGQQHFEGIDYHNDLTYLDHMVGDLPEQLRGDFYEFVTSMSYRIGCAEQLSEEFGIEQICDGTGIGCQEREGEMGANAYIWNLQNKGDRRLAMTLYTDYTNDIVDCCQPLVDSTSLVDESQSAIVNAVRPSLGMVEGIHIANPDATLRVLPQSCETVASAIVSRVRIREHLGHRLGQKMKFDIGRSTAKLMFLKIIMMMHLFAAVPTAQSMGLWGYGNGSAMADFELLVHDVWANGTDNILVFYDVSVDDCYMYQEECIPVSGKDLVKRSKPYCDLVLRQCQLQVLGKRTAGLAAELVATFLKWCGFVLWYLAYLVSFFIGLCVSVTMFGLALVSVFIRFQYSYVYTSLRSSLFKQFSGNETNALEVHVNSHFNGLLLYSHIVDVIGAIFLLAIELLAIYAAYRLLIFITSSVDRSRLRLVNYWKMYRGSIHPSIGDAKFYGSSFNLFRTFGPFPEAAHSGSDWMSIATCAPMMSLINESEKGVHNHVGFAFRQGKYIVTANHVIGDLSVMGGRTLIVPLMQDGDRTITNLFKSKEWNFTEEMNILPEDSAHGYDCYIAPMPDNFFSGLGVSSPALTSAVLDSNVRAYGYFGREVKSTVGQVVKGPNLWSLYHAATTRGGSSGCPIMQGKKVAGLHLGTDSQDKNKALESCMIKLFIEVHEGSKDEASAGVFRGKKKGQYFDKFGREVDIVETQYGLLTIDKRTGKKKAIHHSDIQDYEEIIRMLDTDIGYGRAYESGSVLVEPSEPNVEAMLHCDVVCYDDPCEVAPQATVPSVVIKPSSPRRRYSFLDGTPLSVDNSSRRPSVKTPKFTGINPEVAAVLDFKMAKELGYDDSVFKFPEFDDMEAAVSRSMFKHLEHFAEASKKGITPEEDVQQQAFRIAMDMCKSNRYYMNPEVLSYDSIFKIISSTLIGMKKSPGRNFMVEGLMSNQSVLDRYSVDEIIGMVQSLDGLCDINVFAKLEPHKIQKLISGMPRCISGVGLLEQILCHAYFSEMNKAMAENWETSPIKIGWSPLIPNAGRKFYESFIPAGRAKNKPIKMLEDDAKNWDYSLLEWLCKLICQSLVGLAVRPAGMSEEEGDKWREEAYAVALRQFMMPFVLPDGTIIHRLKPCIMTSGSVLTLAGNSMGVLLCDIISKLQMKYSKEEILRLFVVAVGGDDKIQRTPVEFDEIAYIANLNQMGLTVHDNKVHDKLDGIEFFSWRFEKSSIGEVVWFPTRFTKHIENLKSCKFLDLKDALVSHAYNWMFDKDKFEFFRNMFGKCALVNSSVFDLRRFPERKDLINRVYGYESASAVPDAYSIVM